MYLIGDFSKITGITAKALRYYHDIELLIPAKIDEKNNYRFYNENQIEPAMIISELKDVNFSLEEIKEIVKKIREKKNLTEFLEYQKIQINNEIKNYTSKLKKLEKIVKERRETMMSNIDLNVQEKDVPDMLIASIKHQGRYKEMGPLFGKLCRACGSRMCGTPFTLYYDEECKEQDANYEVAIPIKSKVNKEGIEVKELKGGHALTVIHKGSYESIGNTYKKIIDYTKNKQIKTKIPSREVYIKGPGFIFKNPKKYVTEIQFMI